MKMSQMYPSKYLKADELGDSDHGLTITKIVIEQMGQGQEKDEKPVAYFHEVEKGLVLNVTKAKTLTKIFGSDDSDDWVGKKITIYAGEVSFQGDMVACINIRLPRAAPTMQFKQANNLPSKESAWAAVKTANGGQQAGAEAQWKDLRAAHGENWSAIIAAVTGIEDLGISEENVPF